MGNQLTALALAKGLDGLWLPLIMTIHPMPYVPTQPESDRLTDNNVGVMVGGAGHTFYHTLGEGAKQSKQT